MSEQHDATHYTIVSVDEVNRLRVANERLRAALELYASYMNWSAVIDERGKPTGDWYWDPIPWVAGTPWEIASRALSPEHEGTDATH